MAGDIVRVAVVADRDLCGKDVVVVCLVDIHTFSVRCGDVDAVHEVCIIAHPDGRGVDSHQQGRGADEDAGVELHVGLTGGISSVYKRYIVKS